MDNLTHSLVGLLCADVVARACDRRGALAPWPRAALYVFAIVGNNLPDLDFSYSRISGREFGYLLQHRGYTHTLPAVLGFALALLAVFAALSRWRGRRLERRDWWVLSGVALASPLLHIVMDFANNYGVHPFWPLHDAWFYGDSFFILEPGFWLVIVAPLAWSYRSRWARGALWLVLGVALASLWYQDFVPMRNALAWSALTLALLVLSRGLAPRACSLLALGCFLAVAALFVGGSRVAKRIVLEQARASYPRATVIDIVATPTPANPFCWGMILVQAEAGRYSVRIGRAATFPAWLEAAACPHDRAAHPTALLQPMHLPAPGDARLVLGSEYLLPVASFQQVFRERCEARAFFRWARVPYLTPARADGSRVLGDLRYDRNPGLDFSDIRLARAQGRCPEYVPPWLPARADILDAPAR